MGRVILLGRDGTLFPNRMQTISQRRTLTAHGARQYAGGPTRASSRHHSKEQSFRASCARSAHSRGMPRVVRSFVGHLRGAACYRFRYRSCRPELHFVSSRVQNVRAAIPFQCGLVRSRSPPSGQTSNFVNSRSSVQPRPPALPFQATTCGGYW